MSTPVRPGQRRQQPAYLATAVESLKVGFDGGLHVEVGFAQVGNRELVVVALGEVLELGHVMRRGLATGHGEAWDADRGTRQGRRRPKGAVCLRERRRGEAHSDMAGLIAGEKRWRAKVFWTALEQAGWQWQRLGMRMAVDVSQSPGRWMDGAS